jgi:PKD repeat protein
MKKLLTILLFSIIFQLSSQTIVKGPYMQIGTQNSMIVRWETNIATNSQVAYGTSSVALTLSVTNVSAVTVHSLQITGLAPYTKYYYSIGTTTSVLQGDQNNYFQTSPVPGTAGNYRFWVVGDCGNASTNQINVKNQYVTFNGPNKITDGWLLLGDNAYTQGTDAQFNAEFFNIYQNDVMKKMVLWPTPGNHDYNNGASTATTVPYYSIFSTPIGAQAGGVASGNPAYYSYDYGNIHFISLDSYGTVGANKMYDTLGAQAVWLKADLAANTKRWTIAYWHHPPYTMGSHNSDGEADLVAIRTNFIRILERNKVDLIMCGHSHDYERSKLMKGHYGLEATFSAALYNLSTQSGKYDGSANSCPYLKDSINVKNGTVYVLSGSAGQLGGTQASFPHNAMHFSDATNGGSLVLDIQNNRLDAQWVCADGVIRDKFTIYKDVNSVKSYTVLPGINTTLTASWPGNYLWSNSASTQSIVVNPTTTTTYWVKDPNNCIADTFKLNVLPSVNFTSSPAYCSGNSISFNDLSTNSPISWNWSVTPAAGVTINTPTSQNPTFNFTNAGNYSVSLISNNAYGPGLVVTNTITFLAAPNLTASASASAICNGQTATLSITGATTYTWNTGSNSTSIAVSPSVNTTYTVSGSAVNGCISSKTISLVSNPNPTVNSTSSSTVICSGQNATLTANGATNYTWNPGALTGTAITVSPITNQTYSITGSNLNGCSGFSTKTISVTTTPTVSVNSQTICPGSTATLIANGASNYTWNPVGFNGSTFTVSPVSNTTYSIIGANGLCTDVKTASVIIGSSVSISVNSPTICNGQTTTLTANGVTTYTWSTGSNNQSINVSPATTTSYTINGSSGTCNGTQTTVVTVNSNPTITATSNISLLCVGQNATLTVNGANTYTWNPGGIGNSIVVTPSVTSNYSVTGISANGCLGVTAITQSVSTCTGIETIAIGNNSSIVIYPNPNNGTFTIDLIGNETYSITIYDIASKLIYNGQLQTGNNLIELKSAPGIYFYNIIKGKQSINKGKIIIQ